MYCREALWSLLASRWLAGRHDKTREPTNRPAIHCFANRRLKRPRCRGMLGGALTRCQTAATESQAGEPTPTTHPVTGLPQQSSHGAFSGHLQTPSCTAGGWLNKREAAPDQAHLASCKGQGTHRQPGSIAAAQQAKRQPASSVWQCCMHCTHCLAFDPEQGWPDATAKVLAYLG